MDYRQYREIQTEEIQPWATDTLHIALGVIDSITDEMWLTPEHHDMLLLAYGFLPEDDSDALNEIDEACHARIQDFYRRHPEHKRIYGLAQSRADQQ